MPRVRSRLAVLLTGILSFGAGCSSGLGGDESDDILPDLRSELVQVGWTAQTGQTGAALSVPLVVQYSRVSDATHERFPTSGVVIDWQVDQGGGTLGVARTSTGSDGMSQNTWVLGPTIGAQAVRATVNGTTVSVVFDATATAPQPPPPPGVSSVTVSPQGPTVQVQQTTQLTATVTLASGANGTPVITWSSEDEAKATVS